MGAPQSGADKYKIGHFDGTSWANAGLPHKSVLETNTDYDLRLEVRSSVVTLSEGGEVRIAHDFAEPLNDGLIGLGTHKGVARFDNLSIPHGALLPHDEDFDDGKADFFAAQKGLWDAAGGQYRATPNGAGNDAMSLLKTAASLPVYLRISATSMLHIRDPDSAGHAAGWMSNDYLSAVDRADDMLGQVFDLIEKHPVYNGKTAIVLTSDHGGLGGGHGDPTSAANYTIPLYVWGPGVTAGADLYALNPATRLDPVTGRPDYTGLQPIRNGGVGNLALSLLGLPPIAGSGVNEDQSLGVM